MPQYFISHSTNDRAFVEEELIGMLKALNITPWYAPLDIKAGYFEKTIKTALAQSDALILVMSPGAIASEWVKDELSWAMEKIPDRIIPILYKKCKPADLHIRLPRLQHADFTKSGSAGLNKLLSMITSLKSDTGRITAINGEWRGTVHQYKYFDGKPVDFPIELKLYVTTNKDFSGSVAIKLPQVGKINFTVTGGFLHDRFVQFFYNSADPETIQFGSAILELDSDGKRKGLNGYWIGYGAKSKAIVNGELSVRKISKRTSGQ